ncbi:MAG: argininosuccinate synthase, partial [Lachnospiraceae bacterium]|nr:argininosuccinate synthase [Lachnospiraceae bacterium]
KIGEELAQTIYEGKWFTPLTEALVAFIKSTQENVTGDVTFRLYKGNIIKAGETSPYSLYDEDIASFTTGDLYDHKDASGFITLFGLSTWVRALKMQGKSGKAHRKSPTAATTAKLTAKEAAARAKKGAKKAEAKAKAGAKKAEEKAKAGVKKAETKAKSVAKKAEVKAKAGVKKAASAAKANASKAKSTARSTAAKIRSRRKKG